jgi:cephalosporin hydroxylase
MNILPEELEHATKNGNHHFINKFGIHHFCDYEIFYQKMVEEAQTDDILIEIGVLYGGGLSVLADEGFSQNKRLTIFGLDFNKEHVDIAIKNMERLGFWNVTLVLGDSTRNSILSNFPDEKVFMVFLDASHDYHLTYGELETWWPKVKTGGYLAGHDYFHVNYPGVKKAVDEFAKTNNLEVQTKGSVFYIKKL